MRNVLNGGVSQLTGAARTIYDNLNLGARCATLNGEDKAFVRSKEPRLPNIKLLRMRGKKRSIKDFKT